MGAAGAGVAAGAVVAELTAGGVAKAGVSLGPALGPSFGPRLRSFITAKPIKSTIMSAPAPMYKVRLESEATAAGTGCDAEAGRDAAGLADV